MFVPFFQSVLPSLFLSLSVSAVANVHIPKDKVTQMQQGFGFVEFKTEEDADYALRVLNMVKLVRCTMATLNSHEY